MQNHINIKNEKENKIKFISHSQVEQQERAFNNTT